MSGGAVVFVRGEGRNGKGELANPLSSPAGGAQEVWIAAVSPSDGVAPRRV